MKTFNNLEECIKEIKRLRIQVDALIQIANENKTSAETTLAWRELQLAKAWLGKLLGDVSKTPSPYPQVSKPEFIPPTTEVAELAPYTFNSPLDMCNSQRNILDTTIEDFRYLWYGGMIGDVFSHGIADLIHFNNENFGLPKDKDDHERAKQAYINLNFDYKNLIQEHLEQAKIWYGFEIANLRTV